MLALESWVITLIIRLSFDQGKLNKINIQIRKVYQRAVINQHQEVSEHSVGTGFHIEGEEVVLPLGAIQQI